MDNTACTKITKAEFLDRFCEKKGCSLKEASDIYEMFIETLLDEILKGNKVIFTGFGNFFLTVHKNHKIGFAGADAEVSDYLVFKFQPSLVLTRNRIRNNKKLLEKVKRTKNNKKG